MTETLAPRIVLDTNVLLDWLVYDEPAVRPLIAAIQTGRFVAVTQTHALEELKRVLEYPQFKRFLHDNAVKMLIAQSFARQWPEDSLFKAISGHSIDKLPKCKDPDDQPFLELARDSAASWLVSKDKALLELNRARYRLPFAIVRPEIFIAQACRIENRDIP
jgi:uncharacterized protein